jgi:glutamate-1-semialdehyde aminotransferase
MANRRIDTETDKRARGVIAQAALTNSKRPESFVKGVYPTHAIDANGVIIRDSAGNKYVDFVCGLGTNLLGYGHHGVLDAAAFALRTGVTLSLSTVDEVMLGEKVREIMPFVERIKIVKTGSEGCDAAVRIARAYKQLQRMNKK